MSARFGVDLLTLLNVPVSATTTSLGPLSLPPAVGRFLKTLSILSYDSALSERWVVYNGIIQTSIFQSFGEDAEDWPLRIPGLLETGLPFRLFQARERSDTAGGEQIEGAADRWLLQFSTQGISVRLPFDAADFIPESATRPAYLVAREQGRDKETRLSIDTGVLEISSEGNILVRPNLSMSPDPYHGALIRFRVEPTQFFIYEESVGMRVGEVILDLSELVSPPEAEKAGFGPGFRGAYLEEIGIYFPQNSPFIAPKSITLREALIGTNFAGEGVVEFAAARDPAPIPTFIDHNGREITPDSNNIVRLQLFSPGGVIDSRLHVIAVADARDPWGSRRDQARWVLPDAETFTGSRTEQLEVRPGDILKYSYAPAAADSYEPPTEQSYTFEVEGGVYPRGTIARIGLEVQRGADTSSIQHFFDVTHINAHVSAFVAGDGSASDLSMKLVALNERGDSLEETIDSTWLINDRPVASGSGSTTRLNLAEHIDTTESPLPADPSQQQAVTVAKSTLRISLSAEGFRRSVVLDVIGDARMSHIPPIVVHRPLDRDVWADHWTAVEIGVDGPLMVREPGDQQKFHFGSAIALGRLKTLAQGPEPILDRASSSDGSRASPRTLEVGTIRNEFRPGYVYELIPGTPPLTIQRPTPRPTQISFFFRSGKSTESDIIGAAILIESQSRTISSNTSYPLPNDQLVNLFDGLQSGVLEIVGRSSTKWSDDNEARRVAGNQRLGRERAQTASAIMQRTLEQAGLTGAVHINTPRGEEDVNTEANSTEHLNLQNEQSRPGSVLQHDEIDPSHNIYQRADVFITNSASVPEGPAWQSSSDEVGITGARRVLLPIEPVVAPEPIEYQISTSSLKRLRLSAKWDRNPFPTKMEIMAILRTSSIEVDAGETGPQAIDRTDIQSEEDLWRLVLSLVTDAQSGLSRWSLTFDAAGDQDGLFSVNLPPLLGTLFVFGPLFARMAQAEASDGDAEVNEAGWITLGVLAGASIAAEAAGIIDNVKLIANGISVDLDTRGGPFSDVEALYLKLDYSIEFQVREPVLLGIETHPDHPVRLRFRNVGFAYHHQTGDIRILYDEEAEGDFSIEDAGTFRQSPGTRGALASLIQVVGARLGRGSVFIELDLRFVIDIGLLEIKQTTIRLIFSDDGFKVELRGLGVKIEIPNTLVGEGSLIFRDNGFRATLALEVVPAKLYAAGSLEFQEMGDWTAVGVGLLAQFPVGLPLGGSGLAIYGLLGAFGANMKRAVADSGNLVENELQWVGKLLNPVSANSAFTPNRDSWTFGVGAVVGTLPDAGSSFHAKGALALELPGPTVIFGVDVQFISKRRGTEGGNDLSSAIRGLIGITPDAFIIGIRVDLSLGDILRVKIPVDALFPTQLSAADRPSGYLRIGTDGSGGRTGDPVMVELKLSDFIGVEAWLFLMIEERGIVDLGRKFLGPGSAGFPELQGFSIGFGMGISLFLGVREIGTYLEVELLAIAGMGTSPIVIGGFIQAKGTLSILWVGFGVTAMLDFLHRQPGPALPPDQRDGSEISEPETTFKGKFCAEINLLFFSIKECFSFELGSGDPCVAPAPPPLIPSVGFVDRRGFEMARVELDNETGEPTSVPVVWPDTTVVLNVLAEPDLSLAPESPFSETLTSTDHRSLRVGEFDYEFVLEDLRLEQREGNSWVTVADKLDAAMWFPTGRPAFQNDALTEPPDRVGHGTEARSIGLLTWDPIPWARALVPGEHPAVEADIEEAVDNLCEASESELRDCARLGAATPAGVAGNWNVRGEAGWADLVAKKDSTDPNLDRKILEIEESLDLEFLPMTPLTFPFSLSTPAGNFDAGLRSPQFQQRKSDGLVCRSTFSTRLDLIRTQYRGSLLLLVNEADFKFNIDEEALIPGPHDGKITTKEAFVVVTDTNAAEHIVQGTRIGTFRLGEAVNVEPYSLWLFETINSDLGDGDFNSWHVPSTTSETILLQACGSDTKTREAMENRNRDRENAFNGINERIRTDTDVSRFVLQADTRHRVTARWRWTGRRVADPVADEENDRISCNAVPATGSINQAFEFQTAPAFDPSSLPALAPNALPAPPQAGNSDINYSTFDVRDLNEYLKHVPSFDAPPMFTDDLIHIEYHVDHINDLLDRYNRTLSLEVIRTDTPTGANPNPTRLQLAGIPDYWEKLLLNALASSPCIEGSPPARGGGELLAAQLEPNARYDLLVTGPMVGSTEELEQHLIRRAPFQTSRYADPSGLFAALGWATLSAPLAYRPADIILDSSLDTSIPAMPAADVDFELGLTSLSLDIEQPEKPSTTLLWKPPLPTPKPAPPSLTTGLRTLGAIRNSRVDVPALVDLLVRRARSAAGIPIRVTLPPLQPRPPFRRGFGERYGLDWFHDLLVAENLDEEGDVVMALGTRMTKAFRTSTLGGLERAVSILAELVQEIFRRPPLPRVQGWRVAGVMLQSLEPIEREGRLHIESVRVGSSETELTLRRSNTAGSRLLFMADTPVEMLPNSHVRLQLRYAQTKVSGVTDGHPNRITTTVNVEHMVGRTPQSIDWEV